MLHLLKTTRTTLFAFVGVLAWLSAGCAAAIAPMVDAGPVASPAACRVAVTPGRIVAAATVAWKVPFPKRERDTLNAWCDTTGPPVVVPQPDESAAEFNHAGGPTAADEPDRPEVLESLAVVTWNVHGGSADVAELVRRLRSGALTGGRPQNHFVLLLQEAYRAGEIVPRALASGVKPPRAVGRAANGHSRVDIVALAQSLGLALYYVPSMRNGAPSETNEDRGNAVLSTEPLADFTAIELPFERQRRVAIAATVSGQDRAGDSWNLRVASVHLESMASARHLWIWATGVRVRQARGLLDALRPHGSLVVGGDLNTWFGFSDPAYRTVAEAVPDVAAGDRRRTFPPFFRLDHLFSQPPDGWSVAARRLDDRLGSDHYPILADLRPSVGTDSRAR